MPIRFMAALMGMGLTSMNRASIRSIYCDLELGGILKLSLQAQVGHLDHDLGDDVGWPPR